MVENNSEEQEKGQMPDVKRGMALWKVVAVLAVIVAAGGVIAFKQTKNASSQPDQAEDMSTNKANPTDTSAQAPERPEPSQQNTTNRDDGDAGESFSSETVLATVDGTEITLAELEKALQAMPQKQRASFQDRHHAFLDQLVSKKLLLQEARTQGITTEGSGGNDVENAGSAQSSAENESATIDKLLQQKVLGDLEVTEDEIRNFYEENKDQMPAERSYEELKSSLRRAVMQEKERKAVNSYIKNLQDDAAITRNQEWIEVQKESSKDNPLDNALAKDIPVLADFGRGQCRPCEMMKPILKKMKKDYKGKAEILIINIDEHRGLAQRVGVRAIPTQVFYDAEGNEVSRHQGFMSRDKMDERLEEMGVE